MKKLYILAAMLLGALTLPLACVTKRPEGFKDLASEATQNRNIQEAASKSSLITTVTIDKEHRVFLDKEDVGTTEDVSLLKEKLAQALERREKASKDATPTANAESGRKVVFIRAPSSFTYGEVEKVIEAIKSVGGEPIGLQDSDAAQ